MGQDVVSCKQSVCSPTGSHSIPGRTRARVCFRFKFISYRNMRMLRCMKCKMQHIQGAKEVVANNFLQRHCLRRRLTTVRSALCFSQHQRVDIRKSFRIQIESKE